MTCGSIFAAQSLRWAASAAGSVCGGQCLRQVVSAAVSAESSVCRQRLRQPLSAPESPCGSARAADKPSRPESPLRRCPQHARTPGGTQERRADSDGAPAEGAFPAVWNPLISRTPAGSQRQ